ncbi:MAG TPA: protein-export chaperone SecB [Gammaproteobacteria bacterium]|nr:protein-export chaperone SecB [Gammaproteobacteria bacterium]
MAETPNSTKQVLLNRIYVKDSSFESPRAPEVFSQQINPDVKVAMRTTNQRLDNNFVEVTLIVTADAQAEGRSVFVAEVHQAGLFTIAGFNESELNAILMSYCPSILFPYAREAISDLVLKGSMPALLLQPVNFDAVMMESMAQAAEAAKQQ